MGILLLLASAWWPLKIGFFSVGACGLIFYYPPRSWPICALGCMALWVGYLYWLPYCMTIELGATKKGVVIVTSVLLLYLVLSTSSICLFFWRSINRRLVFFMVIIWMTLASLPFLSFSKGFNLINPLLPTLFWAQQWIIKAIKPKVWDKFLDEIIIFYLPPSTTNIRSELVQDIYKELYKIPSPPALLKAYIVMPESAFPYSLTLESKELFLWQSALPNNTTLVFGGVFSKGTKKTQALFFINKSLITAPYEKKTCIDYFESPPDQIWLKKLLGRYCPLKWDTLSCSPLQQPQRDGWHLVLCSDLFLSITSNHPILCCVNECWLPVWLQSLWQGYAIWRALFIQKPLLWVGHQRCFSCNTYR